MYLKYKFGQTGPKIKASLNLHEYSHTWQFEDSKCKYDNKRIQIQIQTWENVHPIFSFSFWHQNLLSS